MLKTILIHSPSARTLSSLLLLLAISLASSRTSAQAPPSSSKVTIPSTDWTLCRQYKETLKARISDLNSCTTQGIDARTRKDQCVGELSGKRTELRECRLEANGYQLRAELLEDRSPWFFWLSVGAFTASTILLSVETLGGSPELHKVLGAGAISLVSLGVLVWSF